VVASVSLPLGLKIAFIGPWNHKSGPGAASRGYISALRHASCKVNLYPIRVPSHVQQQVPAVDICDFSGSAEIAVVHLPPDRWLTCLTEGERAIIECARVKIGLSLCNTPDISANWDWVLDQVDAIWTPSHFCADIFAKKTPVRVAVVPYVVSPSIDDPTRIVFLRRLLGLSNVNRMILLSDDDSSDIIQNPMALLSAFSRSQLVNRGWRLFLKMNHRVDAPETGVRLRRLVERTSGAMLIDGTIADPRLMQATDLYVSPHCSAQFGTTIAYTMGLGKIVVATDYGGSRDFLDIACGFPVPYDLDRSESGRAWVDEHHLTKSLIAASQLVEAGDLSLAEAARRRIRDLFSPTAVADSMQRSLSRLIRAG